MPQTWDVGINHNRPGDVIRFAGDETLDEPNNYIVFRANANNHSMDYYRQITRSVDVDSWTTILVETGDQTVYFGGRTAGPDFIVDGKLSWNNGIVDNGNNTLTDPLLSDYQIFYGGRGVDVLTGGGAKEILLGGASNDTLIGGGGADTLIGGAGDDTYNANPGDTIIESDGLGVVIFNGDTLSGGTRKAGEIDYHSADGKYTYQWSGGDLVINGAVTVKDFNNDNDLGIHLVKNISPNLTFRDLGTEFREIKGINNAGQIVGSMPFGDLGPRAALWQNGATINLGRLALDPGDPPTIHTYDASYATSINNAGQIVGYSTPAWGYITNHAFLWQGTMIDISRDTSNTSRNSTIATDINNVGQIVGTESRYSDSSIHAFMGQTFLSTPVGFTSTEAWAINDAGQIVGSATASYVAGFPYAFLWQNGTAIDLGFPVNSNARDINNAGQVIVNVGIHSFLWQNGVKTDLGSLNSQDFVATSINNVGQITGYLNNGSFHSALWQNGTLIDLNSLLPTGTGWELRGDSYINDNALIVTSGLYNGVYHSLMLDLPSILLISASNINENVVANSVVGKLSSTDSDAGNIFNYSLVTGTDSSDNSTFTISGNQLQINNTPDFESKSSYNLTVRTTDQSGSFFEQALIIGINNVKEAPTSLAISASSVNENVAANSIVGALSSTDPDTNSTFSYSLVTGTDGADNSAFTVSGNQLLINNIPNFTTKSNYHILVRTTDQDGLFLDKTMTINVIANPNAITGTDGIDNLIGDAGNNTLYGLGGNDSLNGGAGADTLFGGLGDDSYVVDNVSDIVIENLNEGTDKINSRVTYTLPANVENLTLTGALAINGTGTDLANSIIGNAAINILTGGAGNDTLNGGIGTDTLFGGLGNDNYVVENVGDLITENLNEGIDKINSSVTYTLSANVENLTLTGTLVIDGTGNDLDNLIIGNSAANQLNGQTGNDTLNGGGGNDTLTGWSGADIMIGGLGNDTYFVENVGDVITENLIEGTDTVSSRLAYLLPANVENLILTGTTAVNGTGNDLDNSITGNSAANQLNGQAGNDTLNGGGGDDTLTGWSGADIMIGGLGNDTYLVENVGDVVTENLNQGTDTVSSRLAYTLPANVENLILTGTVAVNGTGNGLANGMTGNSAANQLNGGAGNDTLDGGAGTNSLTGGTGNDIFRFTTKGHIDTITDFNVVNDTIQLENAAFTALTTTGTLAASQFKIGTQALDADDFIIYNNVTGALLYDANGSGAGAAIQIATLSAGLAMTNADFVVI